MKKLLSFILLFVCAINMNGAYGQNCNGNQTNVYGGLNYNFKTNELGLSTLFKLNSDIYLNIDLSKTINKKSILGDNDKESYNYYPKLDYNGYELKERYLSQLSIRVGINYPLTNKMLLGANLGLNKTTIENVYYFGESALNYTKGYEYKNKILYDLNFHYRFNSFALGSSIGNNGYRIIFSLPLFN